MANENFEQILSSINNSEIRQALEKLFTYVGMPKGSTGTSIEIDVTGDVTGDITGDVTGDVLADDAAKIINSGADQANSVVTAGSIVGDVTGDVTGTVTKLVVGSAPVNAVPAIGLLTMSGVGVDGEILTVGDDIYEILTGTTLVNGTIAVDCTASHAAADVITNLVAAQAASGTEAFTFLDSDGDTMLITADVSGVLANAEVFTENFTNGAISGTGTFADATQAGVDGTVGDAGTVIIGSLGAYTAVSANTISDANWRLEPANPFKGTGTAPQTLAVTTDLGNGDFESDTIFLDGSTACVITNWTPKFGVIYTLQCIDSTADPTVALSAGIDFNVAGNDTITFPDADDTLVCKLVSSSRVVVLGNEGGVTFS